MLAQWSHNLSGETRPLLEPERLAELERALEADLTARFESTIEQFQATGTGPVGFGKRVQRSHLAYWRQMQRLTIRGSWFALRPKPMRNSKNRGWIRLQAS